MTAASRLMLEIDPGGGLVEHQQPGLTRQGPRDEGALLLPAREPADVGVAQIEQADQFERLADSLPVSAAGRHKRPPPGQPTGTDDLGDRGLGLGRGGALRDVADAGPVRNSAAGCRTAGSRALDGLRRAATGQRGFARKVPPREGHGSPGRRTRHPTRPAVHQLDGEVLRGSKGVVEASSCRVKSRGFRWRHRWVPEPSVWRE